jgi:hypothetical protein
MHSEVSWIVLYEGRVEKAQPAKIRDTVWQSQAERKHKRRGCAFDTVVNSTESEGASSALSMSGS